MPRPDVGIFLCNNEEYDAPDFYLSDYRLQLALELLGYEPSGSVPVVLRPHPGPGLMPFSAQDIRQIVDADRQGTDDRSPSHKVAEISWVGWQSIARLFDIFKMVSALGYPLGCQVQASTERGFIHTIHLTRPTWIGTNRTQIYYLKFVERPDPSYSPKPGRDQHHRGFHGPRPGLTTHALKDLKNVPVLWLARWRYRH